MQPPQPRGLGRLPAPDLRDDKYPMRLALDRPRRELTRYWYIQHDQVRDQQNTPHCVGYSWFHWMVASPHRTKDGPEPVSIYRHAQLVDEWPGENYDGTSVRAGVKILQELGHVESYVWTHSIEELKVFVLTQGTVVIGTEWTENMFYPDRDGFVWPWRGVMPDTVGGHAYLCIGYSAKKKAFRFVNSWGRGWGQNGRFWMHEDIVQLLLNRNGEACAALERPVKPL